jgi:hypothetical protein
VDGDSHNWYSGDERSRIIMILDIDSVSANYHHHNMAECEHCRAMELLSNLNFNITTVHLDMGGQNRYTLNEKAHKIIDEIKKFLM